MLEKTLTFSLRDKELAELEEKYECNREVLNLALDFALDGLKEHIINNLHDDVEDACIEVG